jgi:hypothetical protein
MPLLYSQKDRVSLSPAREGGGRVSSEQRLRMNRVRESTKVYKEERGDLYREIETENRK